MCSFNQLCMCSCAHTKKYLWLHKSISLTTIIQCEKCSHLSELSGNLYFDTLKQQLSSCDRKQSLLCWLRAKGWWRRWGGEQRQGDYCHSFPVITATMQVANSPEKGGIRRRRRSSCWAETVCTLTNKWEAKGVISTTETTLILKTRQFNFCAKRALTSITLCPSLPISIFLSHTPSGLY